MAFTRKFLSSLGIGEEQVDTIIDAHTEVTDALKTERDKYKADAEKLSDVQRQLDEALKSTDDSYKQKYEDEHKAFEEYRLDQDQKEASRKKEAAYREILKNAGIQDKRIGSVLKVSKDIIDKIELDENGKAKNADDLRQSATEDWKDFITTQETHGTDTHEHDNVGGGGMTKDDILKIEDPKERQTKIAENHELFGF